MRSPRFSLRALAAVGVWLVCCFAAAPGQAASEAVKAEDAARSEITVSRAALIEILRQLDTAELDDVIQSQLQASAEPDDSRPLDSILGTLDWDPEPVKQRLIERIVGIADIPSLFVKSWTLLHGGQSGGSVLVLLATIVGVLLVAGALEYALGKAVRRGRTVLDGSTTIAGRTRAASANLAADLAGIIFFTVTAWTMVFMSDWVPQLWHLLFLIILTGVASVRLYLSWCRAWMSPQSDLRLMNISDHQAVSLLAHHRWIAVITAVGFLCEWFFKNLGLEGRATYALHMVTGYVLVGVVLLTAHRCSAGLVSDLSLGERSCFRERFAARWPSIQMLLAVMLLLVVTVLVLSGVQVLYLSGLGTLFCLMFVVHVDALLTRLDAEVRQNLRRANDYQTVLLRSLRLGLWFFAALFLVHAWGFDMKAVAEAGIGGTLTSALSDILVMAFLGFVLWEFVRLGIDRRIAEETASADESDGDEGGAGGTRLATLLPLLRGTFQIGLLVVGGLIVLSELGINIGPLLAGAGVAGIAVGFGAQTLVRDIFSGVFFLIDDAFRVGEYIETGSVKGTVEKISIRSMQLRHHTGPLHTVSFGNVGQLTNYSRDWVIMKLPLRLTFGTDPERVRKLIKKLGQELQQHPEIGDKFLEPLKSQGVFDMDDSALVSRVKFKTRPGDQFGVRKVVYAKIRDLFESEGIQFASREVRVRMYDTDETSANTDDSSRQRAAAAAAREASSTT